MNGWTAVGYIGVVIGVFLLIIGLSLGLAAYNAVSGIGFGVGEQLGTTVFMAAFTPYAITGGMFLLGGLVASYAGRPRESQSVTQTVNVNTPFENEPPIVQVENTPPNVVRESPLPPVNESMLPLPKQAVCPSCEYPIVFIEEYQRWYCVYERKYI